MKSSPQIAVVIPCFRARLHVLEVIERIGPEVTRILLVDDACPEETGNYVLEHCSDTRLEVVALSANAGVGGATMAGFRRALETGADVVVKVDGDGQMDPRLIPKFVRPILEGRADYVKGNRFYDPTLVTQMPPLRIMGNAVLSFLTKLSSGYWNVFDPTNGYVAIHAAVLRQLPLDKIARRFFFESDMLFRLNTIRAVVVDVPMRALYNEEKSNLRIPLIIPEFLAKNLRNFIKRLFYNYYLRGFNIASIEIVLGNLLVLFGTIRGGMAWYAGYVTKKLTPAGTIMLAALPIILGLQMILGFISYDIQSVPQTPIHPCFEDEDAGLY